MLGIECKLKIVDFVKNDFVKRKKKRHFGFEFLLKVLGLLNEF